MTTKTMYTAHATVTGGRDGKGETDDKKLSVALSRPGSPGGGTNPEQLFAVGYAACFGSAISYIAGQKKQDPGAVTVQTDVSLNQGDHGFFLGVTLNVTLGSLKGADANALVAEAHKLCPYSNATRNNIDVKLTVNGSPLA